jgi:hypothetical protein
VDEQDRLAGALLLELELHNAEVDSAEIGFGRGVDSRSWLHVHHG